MKPYRCLLFDLFNTVALWQPQHMPRVTIDGESRASTSGELCALLAPHLPRVALEDLHRALLATSAELNAERNRDLREIPSLERFQRTLLKLGFTAGAATTALAGQMSLRHMEILAGASHIPPDHVAVLERLAIRYPLALVSNFDHGPTARAIVERDGAARCFEHVLVSDGHGWRKPHRRIFDDALALLGCDAAEALFIGDSLEDDVAGAHAAGLDVVWVNARAEPLPTGVPPPARTVRAITELDALLGNAGGE